jgi:hypothetical protein
MKRKILIVAFTSILLFIVSLFSSFKNRNPHGNIKFIIEAALQIPSAEGFSRTFEDSVYFCLGNDKLTKMSKSSFVNLMDSFFVKNMPLKIELQSDQYFDLSKRNLKWIYYSTSNKNHIINIDAKIDEKDDHYHALMIRIEGIEQ